MKKRHIALISTFFIILSCSGSLENDNNITDIGILQNMKQNGLKRLYSSNITVNNTGTSRDVISAGSIIKTITYMNENNNIVPITFITSNGNEVVLNIDHILQIGDKKIIVRYSAIYSIEFRQNDEVAYTLVQTSTGQILIDIDTGKLYDFSEFSSIEYQQSYFVDGNTLFANEPWGTLYKIDLNNISSAIPLNNPDYFISGSIYFKLGNKIITSNGSIDINQEFPPKQILPFILTKSECSFAADHSGEDYPITIGFNNSSNYAIENYYIVDESGDVWYYCFFSFLGRAFVGCPQDAYFICKLTIDDNGQLGFSDFSEGSIPFDLNIGSQVHTIQKNGVKTTLIDGRIVVRSGANHGITITTIDKYVSVYDFQEYYNFSNGEFDMTAHYYIVNGKNIEKIMLFTNDSPEIIYTISDPNVEEIWIFDNRIYYWKWIDALTGATYSIPLGNLSAEPELVTSSTMETIEILEIFEFNF
jgi:hypothetical protein